MNVLSANRCLPALGLLLLLASAIPGVRGQSVPPLVNYQGRLTDDAGAALPNGSYGVAFRLWNRAVPRADGEQLIWSREYDVSLLHGAFHLILGAPGGTAPAGDPPAAVNDLAFAFGDPDRFFGLTLTRTPNGPVAAPRELVPRQQILSAPFAFRAEHALRAGVADTANALTRDLADALCPAGTIIAYGGRTVPEGWLLCDGRPVSSVQYPRLFAAIATHWGSGLPASTNDFNLPDLRGLFLRGVTGTRTNPFEASPALLDPDAAGRTNFLGGSLGNEVGSLQLDELKSHHHRVDGDNSGLTYGDYVVKGSGGGHGLTIRPTTDTGGPETRPRNAYVHYLVKP